MGTSNTNHNVYIKRNECFEKLPCNTICYIEASGSYCDIHTADCKKYTVTQPLGEITGYLCPDTFIRVHRSYVININYVDKYIGNLFYVHNKMIPIGRAYKKEALTHFNIVFKG